MDKYKVKEIIRLYNLLSENLKEEVRKELKLTAENREKLYKIKHKPSGLYYQNLKHRGSNVSETGKTFSKLAYAKAAFDPDKKRKFTIVLSKTSTLIKKFESLNYNLQVERRDYWNQNTIETSSSEWEIVEM